MSHVERTSEINFTTVLERDGSVRLTFLDGSTEVFSALCTPEQVGALATGMLQAVSGSARLGTRQSPQLEAPGGVVNLDAFIPVMGWFFGELPRGDQKAVGVQIGGAKIGFAIEPDRMRGLGRTIIAASWKNRSPFSSFSLLISLLKDFFGDLRSWSSIATARTTALWAQRWLSF